MAEELKRVGLVFTSEGAADLQKTLKNVATEAKNNQNEFKKLTSEYDENTSSVTKLTDKMKYAQAQAETYGDKCTLLKEKLENLQAAEAKNHEALEQKREQLTLAEKKLNDLKYAEEENTEAIQKAQEEYNKTSKEVEKLTDKENNYNAKIESTRASLNTASISMEKFQKMADKANASLESGKAKLEDVSKKLDDFSEKTGKAGSALTTYVTGPVAAVGTAAVAAFKTVDEGLDAVIQKTGATGEEAEQLQSIVKELAASLPADYETIGNAVGEVSTRFHAQGQELSDLSAQFIKYAGLNNVDVVNSIDNVQKVMSAYGVDVSDTALVLDTLNAAGQNTGINLDTLAQSLVTNSATLQEMNLDLAGASEFLGQLETSGVDASTVLAGLKKALTNASAEGTPLSDALSNIQRSMTEASSSADGITAAVDLFGAKAGPAIYEACATGQLSFDNLSATMEDFSGNLDTTFENVQDPIDQLQPIMNQILESLAKLGESVGPVIVQILQDLVPIIQDLTDAWNSLSPGMQEFIVKAGLAAAAAGPILTGISKITGEKGLGGLVKGLAENADSFSKLGTTASSVISGISGGASSLFSLIAANPIIAIITVVVAALVLLYNKCEWFRNGVNEIFGGIRDFIKGVVDKIKSFFDFDWKLPEIKLPHFKISPEDASMNPIDWIKDGIPSFSVEWYKNGGILNHPTIFGTNGSNLMAGGEAGAEAVLPLDEFYSNLSRILENHKAGEQITYMTVNVDHIDDIEDLFKIRENAQQYKRMGSKEK